jgi:hypothetical protein
VVLEVLSDGEVEPLILSGHGEALASAGNGLNLLRRTNTRVDEKAGSGESTGGKDDGTVGLEVDDLAGRRTGLDLNTGDSLALSNDTKDLGVELELEVAVGLGKREVVTDGTSAETVVGHQRRVSEDRLLLARLLDGINLGEAVAREELREDVPSALVNSLAVLGRAGGTGGALIELVSRALNILPLPASRPLVVKVSRLRADKHHGVDDTGTTENATSHAGSISAVG